MIKKKKSPNEKDNLKKTKKYTGFGLPCCFHIKIFSEDMALRELNFNIYFHCRVFGAREKQVKMACLE